MARVTGDGQTCVSPASHLLDIWQTGRDGISVNVSHKSDVLLTNLANGHDTSISKILLKLCIPSSFSVMVRVYDKDFI